MLTEILVNCAIVPVAARGRRRAACCNRPVPHCPPRSGPALSPKETPHVLSASRRAVRPLAPVGRRPPRDRRLPPPRPARTDRRPSCAACSRRRSGLRGRCADRVRAAPSPPLPPWVTSPDRGRPGGRGRASCGRRRGGVLPAGAALGHGAGLLRRAPPTLCAVPHSLDAAVPDRTVPDRTAVRGRVRAGLRGRRTHRPDPGCEFDLAAGKAVPAETATRYLERTDDEFVLPDDSDAFVAAGYVLSPADCVRGIETEPGDHAPVR